MIFFLPPVVRQICKNSNAKENFKANTYRYKIKFLNLGKAVKALKILFVCLFSVFQERGKVFWVDALPRLLLL